MQVTSTTNPLHGLAQNLRLSFNPDFSKKVGLKMIQSGFLGFSGAEASIRPDAKDRQKYNNFATLDHRMGEKYSLTTKASVAVSHTEDRRMGIVANYVDEKNFVAFEYNPRTRRVQALEYKEGLRTVLGTKTLEHDPGGDLDLQLDRNLKKFDFYVNGEKLLSVQSEAAERNARVGLMAPDATVSYSGLQVRQ